VQKCVLLLPLAFSWLRRTRTLAGAWAQARAWRMSRRTRLALSPAGIFFRFALRRVGLDRNRRFRVEPVIEEQAHEISDFGATRPQFASTRACSQNGDRVDCSFSAGLRIGPFSSASSSALVPLRVTSAACSLFFPSIRDLVRPDGAKGVSH